MTDSETKLAIKKNDFFKKLSEIRNSVAKNSGNHGHITSDKNTILEIISSDSESLDLGTRRSRKKVDNIKAGKHQLVVTKKILKCSKMLGKQKEGKILRQNLEDESPLSKEPTVTEAHMIKNQEEDERSVERSRISDYNGGLSKENKKCAFSLLIRSSQKNLESSNGNEKNPDDGKGDLVEVKQKIKRGRKKSDGHKISEEKSDPLTPLGNKSKLLGKEKAERGNPTKKNMRRNTGANVERIRKFNRKSKTKEVEELSEESENPVDSEGTDISEECKKWEKKNKKCRSKGGRLNSKSKVKTSLQKENETEMKEEVELFSRIDEKDSDFVLETNQAQDVTETEKLKHPFFTKTSGATLSESSSKSRNFGISTILPPLHPCHITQNEIKETEPPNWNLVKYKGVIDKSTDLKTLENWEDLSFSLQLLINVGIRKDQKDEKVLRSENLKISPPPKSIATEYLISVEDFLLKNMDSEKSLEFGVEEVKEAFQIAKIRYENQISRKFPPNSLWVDKYRPIIAEEICGNRPQISELQSWIASWQPRFKKETPLDSLEGKKGGKEERKHAENTENRGKSSEKNEDSGSDWIAGFNEIETETESDAEDGLSSVVLISGPVGSLKTSSVFACAHSHGFEVLEVNPTESRSGAQILHKFGGATESQRLAKWTKGGCQQDTSKFPEKNKESLSLILFDEVDIVFEDDRGFLPSVISLAKNKKRPIILTCNGTPNDYPPLLLRNQINFSLPNFPQLMASVATVAACENLDIPAPKLASIVNSNQRDIRQIVNFLQFWGDEAQQKLPTVFQIIPHHLFSPNLEKRAESERNEDFSQLNSFSNCEFWSGKSLSKWREVCHFWSNFHFSKSGNSCKVAEKIASEIEISLKMEKFEEVLSFEEEDNMLTKKRKLKRKSLKKQKSILGDFNSDGNSVEFETNALEDSELEGGDGKSTAEKEKNDDKCRKKRFVFEESEEEEISKRGKVEEFQGHLKANFSPKEGENGEEDSENGNLFKVMRDTVEKSPPRKRNKKENLKGKKIKKDLSVIAYFTKIPKVLDSEKSSEIRTNKKETGEVPILLESCHQVLEETDTIHEVKTFLPNSQENLTLLETLDPEALKTPENVINETLQLDNFDIERVWERLKLEGKEMFQSEINENFKRTTEVLETMAAMSCQLAESDWIEGLQNENEGEEDSEVMRGRIAPYLAQLSLSTCHSRLKDSTPNFFSENGESPLIDFNDWQKSQTVPRNSRFEDADSQVKSVLEETPRRNRSWCYETLSFIGRMVKLNEEMESSKRQSQRRSRQCYPTTYLKDLSSKKSVKDFLINLAEFKSTLQ